MNNRSETIPLSLICAFPPRALLKRSPALTGHARTLSPVFFCFTCARSSSGQESLQCGGECRVLVIQPEAIRELSARGFANRRLNAVMRPLGFRATAAVGFEEQRPFKPQTRVRVPSGVLQIESVSHAASRGPLARHRAA